MKVVLSIALWSLVALAGALAYVVIALDRQEHISAAWILTAALCTYAVGYRFYSKWLSAKLFALDDRRATPAELHDDGRDFVKTNRWIVLGHHFAAISGPGPLVGPVLAAQFGYLPGAIWIPVGVVLAGAVQDLVILIVSMRRDGRSLGEMVKDELGTFAGILSLVAIVSILVILIAVLGLVVVKALAHSPWGTFTILATMPIALFMGVYLRYLRKGRVLEVSVIGVVLLLASVYLGRYFHEVPALAKLLTFEGETLALAIIVYGLLAASLPVWLLLAPRDYLSTFMKLGTILALALGILFVMPTLSLPAITRFVDGTGPVFSGSVFPFCFITIACGAISGFHSLIASGTTPKLITRETHARSIGYGSMLLESAVAIMALIAAATLDPGVYFAINSPAAIVGSEANSIVRTVSSWGFPVSAGTMSALARDLGETTMFGRAGGAPTLAVGMAEIFARVLGGRGLLSLWYHFAIMFEALFILTTIDAGTRVGRFLLQAFLKQIHEPLGDTRAPLANIVASVLLVSAWGYFLVQGVINPLGGINTLWPLFGIANQLLSVIALCLATTILLKLGYRFYALSTFAPLVWVTIVTFSASFQKLFSENPRIGFLSAANALSQKLANPNLPANRTAELTRTMTNLRVDAFVAGFFLVLVGAIVLLSVQRWVGILRNRVPVTTSETPPVFLPPEALIEPSHHGLRNGVQGAALIVLGVMPQATKSACSGHAHVPTAQASSARECPGQGWANRETERFSRPKCC
ncbi:MAG: carbon starvation CstA family protein [Polyangiaceae bacterium]